MSAKLALGILDTMAKRMSNLQPAMVELNVAIAKDQERLFNSSGATGANGRWQPRKPTRGKRAAHRLLMDTKRLFRACSDPNNSDRQVSTTNNELRIKINLPYAGVHHYGAGRMPRRRIFDPTEEQIDGYAKILMKYMTPAERAQGGEE